MNYRQIYNQWCTDPYFDEETKAELVALKENDSEIKDRFYKQLEFGTGGLRGLLGAGTNRMNIYTVRQATQGLANYICFQNGQKKGVAIAYDSRRMSREFAKEAAFCFNANGIITYLFEDLRPTPELSFAVRKLGCIAGLVITASHNSAEYNGYKVYWEDGAQITSPHDKNILSEVNKVTNFDQIKTLSEVDAIESGLYYIIGRSIDDGYIDILKAQSIHPEIVAEMAGSISIVYTPLHGTGNLPIRRALKELGFENVYIVSEQELPDSSFPAAKYPNPEDDTAWILALKLAKEVDADIVLATDPDADRLGVYAKNKENGEYVKFTGNMSGMLIAEYIIRERYLNRTMPKKPAMVKTIVTTDMAKAIAQNYNVKLIEVLTGFKYIGEQIQRFENNGTYNFIFGLEESYGCLAGTYARDKDACSAVLLLCEVAAYYRKIGKTLWDAMLDMYEKYGYYKEGLYTQTLTGIDGAQQIQDIMRKKRENPPQKIGNHKVIAIRDYLQNIRHVIGSEKFEEIELPKSNVLYYELENDAWCCVRPSGTEPKIKFYYGVKGRSMEDARKQLDDLKNDLATW